MGNRKCWTQTMHKIAPLFQDMHGIQVCWCPQGVHAQTLLWHQLLIGALRTHVGQMRIRPLAVTGPNAKLFRVANLPYPGS